MLEDSPNADKLNEDLFKVAGYVEFSLSKLEEDNLTDIENILANGPITDGRKASILLYLKQLLSKIMRIKNQEREYEGDLNANIDIYIARISTLINNISRL